jgi:hypothetical protein
VAQAAGYARDVVLLARSRLDSTETRHDGPPVRELLFIDAELARVFCQERCRSSDVRSCILARCFQWQARECGAALEPIAAQGHHTMGGGQARKFFVTLDHLPARLYPRK